MGALTSLAIRRVTQGIRFRGYSIPELQQKLPTFKGPVDAGEATPEALVWLLLTDTIPTKEQADSLTAELHKRAGLGPGVEALVRSLPKDMHPMTQLVIGLMAEQVRKWIFEPSSAQRLFLSSLHPGLADVARLICAWLSGVPQRTSKFAAAYQKGVHKKEYWKYTLEDILDLWAKLPEVSFDDQDAYSQ